MVSQTTTGRQEAAQGSPGRNPRYGHVRMPSQPTPIPHPHPPREPEPVATEHSRVICCIGGDRFVFDFTATVTELRRQPAEVISIERKRKPGGRKIRPKNSVC